MRSTNSTFRSAEQVKLTMTTEDVLHDFYIPAFRTKADVVPGRYTYLWFKATKPGKYHLVLCGVLRAQSLGYGRLGLCDGAKRFRQLAERKCRQARRRSSKVRTFSRTNSAVLRVMPAGPQQRGAKLEGIYGKDVKLVGGRQSRRTSNTFATRSSIRASQVVEGFQPIMPTFKGQVTEEQLVALVAYIKVVERRDRNSSSPAHRRAAARIRPAGE